MRMPRSHKTSHNGSQNNSQKETPMHHRFLLALGLSIITCTAVAFAINGASDPTQLPLGDGKVTSTPKAGYVMRCGPSGGGGGAQREGPWINSDGTFDLTAKLAVQGSATWTSSFNLKLEGDTQRLTGNNLPNHPTGTYPVAASDPAYRYDRNPNRIQAQSLNYTFPTNPTVASQPSCLRPGAIAVLLTGVVVFDALDAMGRDAVAHEVQDACDGHPEITGAYHYHSVTRCLKDTGSGHSSLMGYALDGFGLFGLRGENGKVLTNADLDECHGHTHEIPWNGATVKMYHYHATLEYPYTISCFRGTRR